MTRHVSRSDAVMRHVPRSAKVIKESAAQIVYVHADSLYVMRLIEIRPNCEDCGTMWVAHLDLQLALDELLKRA